MKTTKSEWQVTALCRAAATSRVRNRIVLKQAITVTLRSLAAVSVFLVAWSIIDSRFPPLGFMDPRALGLAVILLTAGLIDLAKGVVPIEITYPLMFAGIVRAVVVGDPSFLLYWVALAVIYLLNVVGGGDVKLLMGMFGLWPHLEFLVVMEVVVIVTHVPIVLYRRLRHAQGRAQLCYAWNWLQIRFIQLMTGEETPNALAQEAIAQRPTIKELSERGDRLAIAFALGGILYLFLLTPLGLNWNFKI